MTTPLTETPHPLTESDLNRDFERISRGLSKQLQGVMIGSKHSDDSDVVVEPIFSYNIHASGSIRPDEPEG